MKVELTALPCLEKRQKKNVAWALFTEAGQESQSTRSPFSVQAHFSAAEEEFHSVQFGIIYDTLHCNSLKEFLGASTPCLVF